MEFAIKAPFEPAGDQPQAIAKLAQGVEQGMKAQVLLGATGTGKTFTVAQVINRVQKPTLVIAHNKTLAAQLASELKAFFPDNAVEYFVSYYDYYQPEAYIPQTDTYIEKDSSINDEIDKLRHSATSALFERRDVIVVASVSCIYGLGGPQDYYDSVVSLRIGQVIDRNEILRKLVENQYVRNDIDFKRGTFRVRGDVIEVIPASYGEKLYASKCSMTKWNNCWKWTSLQEMWKQSGPMWPFSLLPIMSPAKRTWNGPWRTSGWN